MHAHAVIFAAGFAVFLRETYGSGLAQAKDAVDRLKASL